MHGDDAGHSQREKMKNANYMYFLNTQCPVPDTKISVSSLRFVSKCVSESCLISLANDILAYDGGDSQPSRVVHHVSSRDWHISRRIFKF